MKHIFLILFCLSSLFSCKEKTETKSQPTMNQPKETNAIAFYVGTYTDGNSEGIYNYALDAQGKLKREGLAARTKNPSFLSFNNSKEVLLAANEEEEGKITAFAIKNGSLEQKGQSLSGGSSPCFVSVNEDGFVLTANYGSGSVGLLRVQNDGTLSDLLDKEQHEGKSITDRQEGPHAHSAWFAGGNRVITADLGTDALWMYMLDPEANQLKPADPEMLKLRPGSGPRHLAFHPKKPWIYVLNELNNTITRFIEEDGKLVEKETSSSLKEDFKGFSKAADIHISRDGQFLYASNRGEDSIAVIQIAEDGSLSLIESVSVHGEQPRNFKLSPNEDFLVVANQDSNNIVSFKRDHKTGQLSYISEIEAPKPVCILFK